MSDPDPHPHPVRRWLRRLWPLRRPTAGQALPSAAAHPARPREEACPISPGVAPLPMSRGTRSPVPPGFDGHALLAASQQHPLLFVFLRHFGCTFCREALADLGRARQDIEAVGTRLVLVHMSSEDEARSAIADQGLDDVLLVSDPARILYDTFALGRGSLGQLLGWTVVKRGVRAGLVDGHGVGRPQGDVRQMPGVFLVWRGHIVKSFVHATAADRPDYAELARMPGMEHLQESVAALG